MKILILLPTLTLAACNAGDGWPAGDAAPLDAAAPSDSALPSDSAIPGDATAAMDSQTPSDAAGADLVWSGSMAHPPPGAVKCGHGTFTSGDSQMACMAPSFTLDHWGMQQQPFPRACDAVTLDGGEYDVWCTKASAYVFVHFANLRATGTLKCKGATMLLLGVVYESGNGGGDTGNNMMDGYTGVPDSQFDLQPPIEAYAWLTVDVAGKGATIWLAPTSGLLQGCGAMNSGYRSIVAGVHATWIH